MLSGLFVDLVVLCSLTNETISVLLTVEAHEHSYTTRPCTSLSIDVDISACVGFTPRMLGQIVPGASHDFYDSAALTHSRLAHQQVSPDASGYPVQHNSNVRFYGIPGYWAAKIPATAQGILHVQSIMQMTSQTAIDG